MIWGYSMPIRMAHMQGKFVIFVAHDYSFSHTANL